MLLTWYRHRAFFSTIVAMSLLVSTQPAWSEPLNIFVVKNIITMHPSIREATAVVVRGDRIVSVGTLDTLKPWMDAHDHEIIETFSDKILMPSFVDNHLHPIMVADQKDPTKPLITWGYRDFFHGGIDRSALDEISSEQPIILWHRSFHELIVNTKALEWMKVTSEFAEKVLGVNFARGRLSEGGILVAMQALQPIVFNPGRMNAGLKFVAVLAHRGGVTTIADMAYGMFEPNLEWLFTNNIYAAGKVPFREILAPFQSRLSLMWGDNSFDKIEALTERSTENLIFNKQVKFIIDGAFISQLMQMQSLGFIDGHKGIWNTDPNTFADVMMAYWKVGYTIHVHANGDAGVEAALDALEELMDEFPRVDHRFTFEHFGISMPEQTERVVALAASVNGYYLFCWADKFSEVGLGQDRASTMTRIGSLVRNGVKVSLHSDLPMGPCRASAVSTRKTIQGTTMAPVEHLTLAQALKSVTIDAAYTVNMGHEIGSITAGKKANFAVLGNDLYTVGADALKYIRVWGRYSKEMCFQLSNYSQTG